MGLDHDTLRARIEEAIDLESSLLVHHSPDLSHFDGETPVYQINRRLNRDNADVPSLKDLLDCYHALGLIRAQEMATHPVVTITELEPKLPCGCPDKDIYPEIHQAAIALIDEAHAWADFRENQGLPLGATAQKLYDAVQRHKESFR